MPRHFIFDDIDRGDLEAVQQRVLVDGAVLEERDGIWTPLMKAIYNKKPAIALWLIEHRGQHDVNTADSTGWTALHYASVHGPLDVVQALVTAGANPAAFDRNGYTALHHASYRGRLEVVQALVAAGGNPAARDAFGCTPLIDASVNGHTDIVAFLLKLPAVKATINHISQGSYTAISLASSRGHQPTVQLLLDAGADPTIPAGQHSPLNQALSYNHHAIAALLRQPIAEAERARALHKARCLLDAGAASLACLQGRVEQGAALPLLALITPQQGQQQQQQQEKLRAAAAFAAGVSGGEKDTGLCDDLYLKLQEYMLPAWADKGPENPFRQIARLEEEKRMFERVFDRAQSMLIARDAHVSRLEAEKQALVEKKAGLQRALDKALATSQRQQGWLVAMIVILVAVLLKQVFSACVDVAFDGARSKNHSAAGSTMPDHPIFSDIFPRGDLTIFDDIWPRGNLEAVQQRVRADAGVLEERESKRRRTPLMWAISNKKPAIGLWLIEHRGQHDVNTTTGDGYTALHFASKYGPLAVVKALVTAGANPAALTGHGSTPLILASMEGHTDIVAFLLQLPAVKATIDHMNQSPSTALSLASSNGRQPTVQLLLDACADPTIPPGQHSPLNRALSNNHHAIAALLRQAIAERDPAYLKQQLAARDVDVSRLAEEKRALEAEKRAPERALNEAQAAMEQQLAAANTKKGISSLWCWRPRS